MQNQAIAVIWPSLSRIVAISHDARCGLDQGRQDDAINDSAPPGLGEHKEQALLCVPGTRSCHSEGMSNRYLKNWVSLAQRIAVGRAIVDPDRYDLIFDDLIIPENDSNEILTP
jgi:hypothetical protein